MSSLKLSSFALSLTLNFHICTPLTFKMKPGCGNRPTPHPPQFRWFVPGSMKLMWTENNDFGRALVWIVPCKSPLQIRCWSCFYHINNNNNNNKSWCVKDLHLIIHLMLSITAPPPPQPFSPDTIASAILQVRKQGPRCDVIPSRSNLVGKEYGTSWT